MIIFCDRDVKSYLSGGVAEFFLCVLLYNTHKKNSRASFDQQIMTSRSRKIQTQEEYWATATVWHSGEGGGITVLEHIARMERNRENRMFDRL